MRLAASDTTGITVSISSTDCANLLDCETTTFYEIYLSGWGIAAKQETEVGFNKTDVQELLFEKEIKKIGFVILNYSFKNNF